MSTLHPDTEKDQSAPSPDSATPHVQDTPPVTQQPAEAGTFPRPPAKPPRSTRNRWLIGIALAVLLVLVLSLVSVAIAQLGNQQAGKVSPTPTSPAATATASPAATATATASVSPGVVLGPQACPTGVADAAHWLPIIMPYSNGGQPTVEQVSCASMTGSPSLQTLVTARRADQLLDVYVFTDITKPAPPLIFQLNGLVKGDAKISTYSTVMTAQANQLSSINTGKPTSAMTADLYREFKWSAGSGKMVQTVFPGIFPDPSRYQAEAAQAAVDQGHQPWRLSATQVATTMATSLLNWPQTSTTATLLRGGGPQDVSADVQVKSGLPGNGAVTVTLSRLAGNTSGGIWEAVSVASQGLSITSPAPLSQFRSPIKVTGTGPAFEGTIGQVILLDEHYTKLGQATATGAVGMGQTTFSTTLSFQSTFPAGIQEGALVLSAPSQSDGSIAGAVMEKVLIDGA